MRYAVVTMLLALAAVPAAAQETNDAAAMSRSLGSGLTGRALAEAIEKAAAAPLGSRENPVHADLPEGQRAYLSQLRCGDGTAPAFTRNGNVGPGVYGYFVDAYQVTCVGAEPVTVYMDMYHDHRETAGVPGFTIALPSA